MCEQEKKHCAHTYPQPEATDSHVEIKKKFIFHKKPSNVLNNMAEYHGSHKTTLPATHTGKFCEKQE